MGIFRIFGSIAGGAPPPPAVASRARSATAAGAVALVFCAATAVEAQYFGRNKVEYEDFDFQVLATEHFDIYYYPRERDAVLLAARMAERWYARLARALDHRFDSRQPLILYGSHPDFSQTNVVGGLLGDTVGGVTESRRRRIVMPFAASLAETDHVLGHEIAHAFQYDIAARHGGLFAMPSWFVEGMAEYLSVGTDDAFTAMLMRDAVARGRLPAIRALERARVSPYRVGHALWAYLSARFGERIAADALRAGGRKAVARLEKVTGLDEPTLSREWHAALKALAEPALAAARAPTPAVRSLIASSTAGRVNVGPALSPDGRQIVFFSERDALSIDLFVADAATGTIRRRLATTAANPHFDSLQWISSAGTWDPTGSRFAFTAVRDGAATLVVADMRRGTIERDILLAGFGEIINPAWSPDGRTIAFSALVNGLTDLYTYDLENGMLGTLTSDPFTDLQPAWSPDGRSLIFVSDRFTSDLEGLRFGPTRLVVMDVASRTIRPLPTSFEGRHADPQWSCDGSSVFFLADHGGITNVFRLNVAPDNTASPDARVPRPDEIEASAPRPDIYQITDLSTGVSGPTATSPALTVACDPPGLAYTVYRAGRYEILATSAAAALEGRPVASVASTNAAALADLSARGRAERACERGTASGGGAPRVSEEVGATGAPADDRGADLQVGPTGAPAKSGDVDLQVGHAPSYKIRPYVPALTLDAIGQPYFAAGSTPFGTTVSGGLALDFADMLGERRLSTAIQVGNRLSELGAQAHFLNRSSRWNWGVNAELLPYVRGRLRIRTRDVASERSETSHARGGGAPRAAKEEGGERLVEKETEQLVQLHGIVEGLIAYPFNRASRLELTAGARHIAFDRKFFTRAYSLETGRRVRASDAERDAPADPAITLAEASVALVTDNAVRGPAGPIFGRRSRFEIAPAIGNVSYTRVLVDDRRYFMPVRPYTIATRLLHSGRYGRDADDDRLLPMFVGYPHLVRGYGYGMPRECPRDSTAPAQGSRPASCVTSRDLFGSRVLVANVELRVPLPGGLRRRLAYGALPMEAVLFADAGVAWRRGETPAPFGSDRRGIRSAGAVVRVNAGFFIVEAGAVRPFDRHDRGWTLHLNLRPGF